MIRGTLASVLVLVLTTLPNKTVYSGDGRYTLVPEQIADGVYVFWGQQEPLTPENGGNIVNITADNKNGMPGMGHSGAARAGVENLTKTAAWEWGPHGVRVNTVAPGWVASSGLDTYPDDMKQALRNLKHAVPLGRIASEAEISATVCFLLSRGANFITGQTLFVDGGASMGSAPALYPLKHSDKPTSETWNGFHRSAIPRVLQ